MFRSSHVRARQVPTALFVLSTILFSACAPATTSADPPGAPIPAQWTTHTSHSPDGSRLLVHAGTLHSIPSRLRLLDGGGATVSVAATRSVDDLSSSCIDGPEPVGAELPLPATALARFAGASWPAGYRLEAELGGTWRPVSPTFANCVVME